MTFVQETGASDLQQNAGFIAECEDGISEAFDDPDVVTTDAEAEAGDEKVPPGSVSVDDVSLEEAGARVLAEEDEIRTSEFR